MKKTHFPWMIIFLCLCIASQGQVVLKGKITDSHQNTIGDVSVMLEGTNTGTTSEIDGSFAIRAEKGIISLLITHQGYRDYKLLLDAKSDTSINLGIIVLQEAVIGLNEVSVIASRSIDRQSPVAVSNITSGEIRQQLGDRPFPMVMNSTAGVYAVRQGGGSGDASLFIRGFNQENLALLLNGVPISSVENGLVYWNNWLGLTSATQSIQVQKGMGISRVAVNSVGGTVNIVSNPVELDKGSSLQFSLTDYGNLSTSLSHSTGKLENNMAVSVLASHTNGPGYIDATYVNSWGFYLSISKEINPKHLLVFTGLGGPERHGQRNLLITKQEFDLYGNKYNKDWGSYNGKINNASENFYFKPYFTINHYWKLSDRTFIANSLYYTPGSGGGKWSEAHDYMTPSIFQYRNPSGQIDWEAIYENNANHRDTAMLYTGEMVTGYSKNVQTHFLASHQWAGVLSNVDHKVNENLTLTAGWHYRYFKSTLSEKITDLLGGDFFTDNYSWAVEGGSGRNPVKSVGDIIKIHNGSIINFANLFGQLKYEDSRINAFLSVSATENWYQRYDKYNYVSNIKSKVITKPGWDVKTGIFYSIDEHQGIFASGGYFNRVPYFKFVFGNYTNVPSEKIVNETIYTGELGYQLKRGFNELTLTGYYTRWNDKSFLSKEYTQLETLLQTRALVRGLDALHYGIEIEAGTRLWKTMTINVFGSYGNWKWQNDVMAIQYNDQNIPTDTTSVYANGLFVGGAPQDQVGAELNMKILGLFDLKAQWVYYNRLYAEFDPTTRNNPSDREQPFRIPTYQTLDFHLGMPLTLFNESARLGISCFNALNDSYIVRGEDGITHEINSFRGYWSFGRTFNFSFSVHF